MTTTSMLTSSSATASTIFATINKDGTINEDNRNFALGTTVASTATLMVSHNISKNTLEEIYVKYAEAYVDSLSDNELELALNELDLLEANLDTKTSSKSI